MSSNPVRDLEVAENYPMDSQAMSSNLLQLKQAVRATWMAGGFRQSARYMEREAEAFVEPVSSGDTDTFPASEQITILRVWIDARFRPLVVRTSVALRVNIP
jgi:hypothetical protein